MANIKNELNNIKSALYGKDVRGSIHNGIDAINKEVESTTNRQEHLEGTFDQLIINSGNSNAEMVDARVGENGKSYAKLGDRLDEVDSQLEHITNNKLSINVKDFGAKGDGITDDTQAIQNCFNYVKTKIIGSSKSESGYIDFIYPEIIFPQGVYICGLVDPPPKLTLKGLGQVIIKSNNKSEIKGQFIEGVINTLLMENITFLSYDKCITVKTNNADFSFHTLRNCRVASCNLFFDQVGYNESRSITFLMERCHVSYGVKELCKIYSDKSSFKNNWITHSENTELLYIDSYASFNDNVWVPVNPGFKKAYIRFSASDSVRSLSFMSERFGGEGGQCPIVIVGEVNKGGTLQSYRNQGIDFTNCALYSNSTYNPDGGVGVRGNVILTKTSDKNRTINFINFKSCTHSPDLLDGVVNVYNIEDVTSMLPNNFVISFDYSGINNSAIGANKTACNQLMPYINAPILNSRTVGNNMIDGRVEVTNTSTTGTKKGTFKFNRMFNDYSTPGVFLVVCTGQGDSSYDSHAYSYSSTYLMTIGGKNDTSTSTKIEFTKLHSSKGGASLGANADIKSIHFGSDETGSNEVGYNSQNMLDVTITFGTRMAVGNLYVQPLINLNTK